ncbi:MAG: DUF3172 domain-containing protein [Spirulina sp. SIO3F2]|nr:DUF3172 domain-containing protein [Spirulina sp. SIO3F2]
MKRRSRPTYDRAYEPDYGRSPKRPDPKQSGGLNFNYLTIALLGGVFVLGIAMGMTFSTVSPGDNISNVASREVIDRYAPNPEICSQYGASAIVTDMQLYVTLNPFNVYLTQPVMQPGCVLRRNNWSILQQRKLISNEQVNDCKNRMNTFGFTGNLEGDNPDITCIYQNNEAGNLFLKQTGSGNAPTETEKF